MWFKRSKSKLEVAAEEVGALVQQSNILINELGKKAYDLYNALIRIQEQFDKIRNIPNDKQLQYKSIKKISHSWKQQVEKIESDYETAAKANIGGGAAGVSLGVGVVTLGPTAAMGIATTYGVASTGTAISSLSGAAATNAALAWLGGGALSVGGGGMAAGNALLGLAGPVGWTIAGIALISSVFLFRKAKSDKERLEQIFLLISQRDQNSYKQAIVELNERITRIIDETQKLNEAIEKITTFGLDYASMTEEQQYTLGAYVNLMNASTQLLVNPIMGLQPKYTEEDLNKFMCAKDICQSKTHYKTHIVIYMANLLYKIDLKESDRRLLSKSFKGNKDFRKNLEIEKSDLDVDLFNLVDIALKYKY